MDKVFFKILSSETDFDFEMNLETFLPKLLLKLGSAEDIVRKKIMEILVHVNKRVKSRPDVQLPFDQLIAIFNESAKTSNLSFVTVSDCMLIYLLIKNNSYFLRIITFKNFSLVYIKLGFPRLSTSRKTEILVHVLKCIEGKSVAHQDS